MKNLSKYNLIINMQIAIAFVISIYLANLFNLENSITAGVITLLSIHTTKRQTLQAAIKRISGFILMLILVVIIFNLLGYNLGAFGIFVLIFGLLNSRFNISIGLAPNVVMAGHFYALQTTNTSFILNEAFIYGIGVLMGIMINLIIPMIKNIDHEKSRLDDIIRKLIANISNILDEKYIIYGKLVSRDEYFEFVDKSISNMKEDLNIIEKDIVSNIENDLWSKNLYNFEYLNMRKKQISHLIKIYENSKNIDTKFTPSLKISTFLREINSDFDEYNNASYLIEKSNNILEGFKNDELPKTRVEFENRAILYNIMNDINHFLTEKYEFDEKR